MKTHLIYFSPTGTTKKIVESIADGIGGEAAVYDLTPPDSCVNIKLTDGAAVIGVPVYAGRVPLTCIERLKNITADGVPAVAVCVYGNREYEDALVELRDIMTGAGFRVIAGGAFIGEHSYSTDEKPIAKDRPDAADCANAKDFGKAVRDKMDAGNTCTPEMSGNVPYKERGGAKGITPETKTELCGACGTCADVCPTEAITVSDAAVSDPEKCIMCCACIKVCPHDARLITNQELLKRVDMLFNNFSARKEPALFI